MAEIMTPGMLCALSGDHQNHGPATGPIPTVHTGMPCAEGERPCPDDSLLRVSPPACSAWPDSHPPRRPRPRESNGRSVSEIPITVAMAGSITATIDMVGTGTTGPAIIAATTSRLTCTGTATTSTTTRPTSIGLTEKNQHPPAWPEGAVLSRSARQAIPSSTRLGR